MESLVPQSWWPALRRVQLLLVINACLVALGLGIVVITYLGAAQTASQAASQSVELKLRLALNALKSDRAKIALRAMMDERSGQYGVGMNTIPSAQTNVFPENSAFTSFPSECFAHFGSADEQAIRLCLARSDVGDEWIYVGFDICTAGGPPAHEDRFWLELTSGTKAFRWRLAPQAGKNVRYLKATAYLADTTWDAIKVRGSIRDDKRVAGVIWQSVVSEQFCSREEQTTRVPIRLRLCARDLFLGTREPGSSVRESTGCFALTSQEQATQGAAYESFLENMRARLRYTDKDGQRTMAGTSDWDGSRWEERLRVPTQAVGAELFQTLAERGESMVLGPSEGATKCPIQHLAYFNDEKGPPKVNWDPSALLLRTLASPFTSPPVPSEEKCDLIKVDSTRSVAVKWKRDSALTDLAFADALENQAGLAFALLACVAVLALIINVLVLVPLSRMARQLRTFGASWEPSNPPQLPQSNRPDEVGLVASAINSLVRSVARASEGARLFNDLASHEIRSRIHTLATEQPGNPHVEKIQAAVRVIDEVTSLTKSAAPT